MLIRVATPSDAIPLAELKRDTFRETFLQDGFNIDYPPHDLAAYETQAYSVKRSGQLNDPQCRTWVAESDDGRLVGYARAGPCKLPHPEVTDGAGKSIRSTFGAARKEPAPGARCSIPHLTIWPTPRRCGSAVVNAKAIAFYERRKVGTYDFKGREATVSSSTVADLRSGMPAKPRRRRTGAGRACSIPPVRPQNARRCGSACGPATRRPSPSTRGRFQEGRHVRFQGREATDLGSSTVADLRSMQAKPRRRRTGASRMIARRPVLAGPFGQRWRLMRERPPIGRRHL